MKTTLTTLLLSVLLLVGCMDNSSDLTSPDVQNNQQSTSPNWVKLPGDLGQDFGVETPYTASKLIRGNRGGTIKLKIRLHQHDSEFGKHFVVKAKVKVKKHSFPDEEERLFTITMDPDNAYLNISPSPHTLYKHVTVDWEIKGIDVSEITPDTFDYLYFGNNNVVLTTVNQKLIVDYDKHKIKLKDGIIYPTATEDSPNGTRYGFVTYR
jgi:hypothetical protein